MKRKLFTPILALGLILCLMAPAANAWEFSMDGTFTWRYEVRGQYGANGFFGRYDVDAGAGAGANGTPDAGTFAPLNFWTGFKMTDGQVQPGGNAQDIVSGSDAGYNSIEMSTNMQIRINPAVRIRGNYYIGSWDPRNWGGSVGVPTYNNDVPPLTEALSNQTAAGLLVAPVYLNQHLHGVQRSFSPGYWRTLWLTAQLPWGEIAVGKRPASWGMGLTFDGANNRASESLSVFVPYGPFRIFMGVHPSRRAANAAYFNDSYDKNNTRYWDSSFNVIYDNGPMTMGATVNIVSAHRGGESVLLAPANRVTSQVAGTPAVYNDYNEFYGNGMFKYNNGRFFVNSEVAFYQATRNFLSGSLGASLATTNGVFHSQVNGPTHNEFWGGAVEPGIVAGPAKVTLLGAWLTGNDTRGTNAGAAGVGNRRLVTVGIQPDAYSNTSVFRPYSYLMACNYGMGNTNPVTDTREGMVSDASFYGARLDYAVAANLNLSASFAWAERFSKSGYTWGFVYPNAVAPYAIIAPGATTATQVSSSGGFVQRANNVTAANVPSIPDTALGWEIDAGADWKLLEGLTLRTTVGYWQPGKWFSYAYQDKSVPGWGRAANANAGNNWLTRPDKTIDAIYGVDFKLEGTF